MKGKKDSSPTPKLALAAARSRAYYAANRAERRWKSNKWNREHKEEGRARSRAWPKNNPGKARAKRNAWTAANREQSREIQKTWHAKHPGYNVQKSLECYVRKQEKLAGCKKPKLCQVCRKSGKICFDHCHIGQHFRGWICLNCNIVLGMADDSSKMLCRLAAYIEAPITSTVVLRRQPKPKRFKELLGAPPSKCQVCSSTKRICADHCHKTYLFRGWLCNSCNTALGHAHDSAKLLRKLADYLDNDKLKQKELRKNAKTKK